MNSKLMEDLGKVLKDNSGKIPYSFILEQVGMAEVLYFKPTDNMRLCIIKLKTGHEVLGMAQVLDARNDVADIGNSVAHENAVNELWKVFGNIAKVISYE